MSSGFNGVIVILVGLVLIAATLAFGGVSLELAAPAYGLCLMLALVWAGKLLFARRAMWKHSPVHFPAAAFLGYSVFRYFTAAIEYDARLELFMVLACGFLYFLVTNNIHHARDRNVLFMILVGLAVVQALYGVYQFATSAPTVLTVPRPEEYFRRASGTYICPNHLAGFLEMIVAIVLANVALANLARKSIEKATIRKVFLIYAALVILAGIMLTLSRSGWLATGIGVLSILAWGDWRSRAMWIRLGVAAGALAVLAVVAYQVPLVHDYIMYSMSGDGTKAIPVRDASFGGRSHLWAATWDMIKDFPLLGTGPGSWQWVHLEYRRWPIQMFPDYAHNDILNLTSDYGLVGVLLLLTALGCFVWNALVLAFRGVASEHRAYAVGGLVAVTMILIHSWSDYNLHIPANAMTLTTLIGLVVAMDDSSSRFRHVELKRWLRYVMAGGLILIAVAGFKVLPRAALAVRSAHLGHEAKRTLDWPAATNYYQRAIELDAGYSHARSYLADVLRAQAVWKTLPEQETERRALATRAIELYGQALALNPRNSETLSRMGDAYELMNQNEKAVETYLQALKVDPKNAALHMRLGMLYHKLGRDEEAKQSLQLAVTYSHVKMVPAESTLDEILKLRPPQPRK